MKKKFILVVCNNGDTLQVHSKNDGYTSLEIIGLLDFKKNDIIKQICGEVKPDVIKRTVVVEEQKQDK
jgi:hypothetical protein